MAKIKPKTLTCPGCGSAVNVRNVMKAKTVVCRSCDAQIDMSKPNLEILAQLQKQHDSHQGIIPGMRGTLPDGRACEVVGRVRYEDSDSEDTWHWDEWLLLADNGSYLWLEEDEGRFSLLTRYDPEEPPDLDRVKSMDWLEFDGTKYRVSERGAPRLVALQGELTWRATIGDRVHYVDAAGGGSAISIEWTEEEVEFFHKERISRREALTTCGLDALLALDDELPELRQAAGEGSRNAGCAGMIAGGGAILATLGFFCGELVTSDKVGQKSHALITAEELSAGKELLAVDLNAGDAYTVFLEVPHYGAGLKQAELSVDTPLTGSFTLWTINNQLSTGFGKLSDSQSFIADSSGSHVFKLQGVSTEGTQLERVDVHVTHSVHTFMGLLCFAPLLLALAVAMFILGGGRKAAARTKVDSEMRKRRAAIIDELHDAATVQE